MMGEVKLFLFTWLHGFTVHRYIGITLNIIISSSIFLIIIIIIFNIMYYYAIDLTMRWLSQIENSAFTS